MTGFPAINECQQYGDAGVFVESPYVIPLLSRVDHMVKSKDPQAAVREGKHKKDSHLEPNNRTAVTAPAVRSTLWIPESGLGDDFLAPADFLRVSVRLLHQ